MNTAVRLDINDVQLVVCEGKVVATSRHGHTAKGKTEDEAKANLRIVTKMLDADNMDGIQD